MSTILNKLAAIYTNRIDNCPVSTSNTSKNALPNRHFNHVSNWNGYFCINNRLK